MARIFGKDLSLSASFPFIKATGELPATPPKRNDTEGLSTRNVQSDPLGDWYLNLPDKLPPKQISSILRQALAGNLWQYTQLVQKMRDTWPMFRKCEYELRAAIASSKFVVHPYALPGKKPTKSAEEKADLVRRALDNFKPDRFSDEDGLNGLVFDLAGAITDGVSIEELIWNEKALDPNGQRESIIRAGAYVHPRNYAFTPEGKIGVAYAAESGAMSFSNQVRHDLMDNPQKFLVARFKSKSGSALAAGLARTLCPLWVCVVYGRDFALNYAQKYGNPFLDIAYQASLSSNPSEVDKFEKLAKQAANQGYFVHPDSAKLEVGKEHSMGADNAQLAIMHLADEACQLVYLGQTLTSTTPTNGGTRAQGDVHENVRQERLEEHVKWIARILTEQFAESLMVENYGNSYLRNPERPTVEADMTRPLSATEQADFLAKVSQSKVPTITTEIYKRAGLTEPAEGDKVLIGGEIVILEEAVTPTEKRGQLFDEQLDQQLTIASFQQPPGQTGDAPKPPKQLNDAPSADTIEAALKVADPDEVSELENLVQAAERSPRNNGEVHAVQVKINHLISTRR